MGACNPAAMFGYNGGPVPGSSAVSSASASTAGGGGGGDPSPRLAPPYNARQWERYAIIVVAPNTATGDAGAILGATALALAESAARGETIQVIQPATVADSALIYTETLPESKAVRVTQFGARVHSSQRKVRFIIRDNGVPVADSQVSNGAVYELSDYADLETPMEFYGDFPSLHTVSVTCTNLDRFSGYLVEVRLRGWSYPTGLGTPGIGEFVDQPQYAPPPVLPAPPSPYSPVPVQFQQQQYGIVQGGPGGPIPFLNQQQVYQQLGIQQRSAPAFGGYQPNGYPVQVNPFAQGFYGQ